MVTSNHYRWDFLGLSTDTKPTPADSERVVDGSTFYETDTSKYFVYCRDNWYEKVATGGDSPDQPLDPQEVYKTTRPADWMKMPNPENEEYYFLLDVPLGMIDNKVVAFRVTNSNDWTLDAGSTDSEGTYTPDSELVVTGSAATKSINITPDKWIAKDNSNQLMVRVKFNQAQSASIFLETPIVRDTIVEISGRSSGQSGFYRCESLVRMEFFALYGDGRTGMSMSSLFISCRSLEAVLSLDTSKTSNVSFMFADCSELKALPALDTSQCTNLASMFQNCSSITAIPQLDTSEATNLSYMFNGCNSLAAAPLLDTSKVRDFSYMFQNCVRITTIPLYDTSQGLTFRSMFQGCRSLMNIPAIDTSSGTSFIGMFQGCSALHFIPTLDTSNGTNFSNMFQSCASLSEIPNLDTQNATSVSYMFDQCTSIMQANLMLYDFSKATGTSAGYYFLTYLNDLNLTIDLGDSFGENGIAWKYMFIQSGAATYPTKIRIHKTDAILPITINATNLFSGGGIYVYVPDDLLTTYQADSYWATLGTRLKPMSEWAP